MSATERLLAAIVDIQHYITHDIDPDKCAACPRWDELQSAAMEAVAEIERLQLAYDDQHSVASLMSQEVEKAEAEVERLRGCRDELREIGKAIHDPRVHNTMTIAEWCDETQAELRRLKSGHCKDCCCARSWEALGITGYTGKSLPEEIEAIKAKRDSLRAALEMVRDADDDCRKDGLPTIPEAARRRIDAAIDAARGES